VFTSETADVKAKSSKNFPSLTPKVPNFGGFGPESQRVEKVLIFTAKGTSVHESTPFKPFCVKIGWAI